MCRSFPQLSADSTCLILLGGVLSAGERDLAEILRVGTRLHVPLFKGHRNRMGYVDTGINIYIYMYM